MSKLLSKKSLLISTFDENTLKSLVQSIPFLRHVPVAEIIGGCDELKVILSENKSVSVFEALFAVSENYTSFVDRAVKALWVPVNNVDAERFFSVFSGVLTDKRTNRTTTNLEILTSIAYENKY